jgi:biopolymer transport protein ExbD
MGAPMKSASGSRSGGDDFSLRPKRRRIAEINLISMIDMLFFLLVFFVLTSSFTSETGLDINKPKASSAKTLSRQPILVVLARDGSIHVNESPVSLKGLATVLRQYASQEPDRAVVIVADREGQIAQAVDILDACNVAGVKKVSISALKE